MFLFQGSKYFTLKIFLVSLFCMISVANASERRPEYYYSALDAIENNDIEAIRSLIGEGLDPNYKLGEPRNFMRLAVFYDKPDILMELLDAGGNVDHKLKGSMYFSTYIAQKNNIKLLEPVLAKNPNLNSLMYVGQYTAFTGMLRFINEETLRYVLDNSNADVNFRPENGLSSLYHAYERGECGIQCVELLLEMGANPCLEIGPSGELFLSYVKGREDIHVLNKLESYKCEHGA